MGLIVESTVGLTLAVTAWDVGAITHPLPTLSEAIRAMAVDGRSVDIQAGGGQGGEADGCEPRDACRASG